MSYCRYCGPRNWRSDDPSANGPGHSDILKDSPGKHPDARAWAVQILIDIDLNRAFANLAIRRIPDKLDTRDRALVTELVYGTTRMRRTLDVVLSRFLSRPFPELKPPLRAVLRLGAYQLLFARKIPQRAAVHQSVTLARRFGHEGVARLTNAVLRRVSGVQLDDISWGDDPIGRLCDRYSYPDWIVTHWVEQFGLAEAEALAKKQNTGCPLFLRTNLLRTSRNELIDRLKEANIPAAASTIAPEGICVQVGAPVTSLPGYHEGWWYVQGEGAMLAAPALDPQPGETIADICAAPGGKTTHLAERMHDQGRLLAVEPHPGRIALIRENARRLGLTCITILEGESEAILPGTVDRVLVDAPCTGLGTLYRKPDLRWRLTPAETAALPALQEGLLESASSALRPGGALLYATCTTVRAENEAVVNQFLSRHPEFESGDIRHVIPKQWHDEVSNGMLQLLPHRHGTEGFFLARMNKSRA